MQRFGEATTPSYIKEFKHGVYYGQSCNDDRIDFPDFTPHDGSSMNGTPEDDREDCTWGGLKGSGLKCNDSYWRLDGCKVAFS